MPEAKSMILLEKGCRKALQVSSVDALTRGVMKSLQGRLEFASMISSSYETL
jgi:hypothetical protein